jgi:hypothetical protein
LCKFGGIYINDKKNVNMEINELLYREEFQSGNKNEKVYPEFRAFLDELKVKNLNENVITFINDCIDEINSSALNGKKFIQFSIQKQALILKLIEKEHKIVPKNHYRNTWGLFGMTTIGLPIGVAIGLSNDNIGLLGLGFPIGIAIGVAIGISMDKKAFTEGRQLNTDIKNYIH